MRDGALGDFDRANGDGQTGGRAHRYGAAAIRGLNRTCRFIHRAVGGSLREKGRLDGHVHLDHTEDPA